MTTPEDPGYGQPAGERPSLQKPPQPGPGSAPPPGYNAPRPAMARRPRDTAPPQGFGAPPSGYGTPAGYGGPGYGGPAGYGPKMSNGLGIAALVIGLISIPFSFIIVGGVFGLLAVILGFVARGKVKRGEANNGGVALAGIITGALAFLIAIAALIFVIAVSGKISDYQKCLDRAGTDQVQQHACATQFGKSITG